MKREFIEKVVKDKAIESKTNVTMTSGDFEYLEQIDDEMCQHLLMLPNYETLEVAVRAGKIINNSESFKKIYKIATDKVDSIDQLPLFAAMILYEKDDTNPAYKYACKMMKLNISKYGNEKSNKKSITK